MSNNFNSNFDPYREWFKIPPAQSPPNYYQLLGLQAFENDQTAIEKSVTAAVNKLQRLSHGPQVDAAQKLLNEVARARLCLTQPDKKQAYDYRLRQQHSSINSIPPAPVTLEPTAPTAPTAPTGPTGRANHPPQSAAQHSATKSHSATASSARNRSPNSSATGSPTQPASTTSVSPRVSKESRISHTSNASSNTVTSDRFAAARKTRANRLAAATLGLFLLGCLVGHLLVRTAYVSRSSIEKNSPSPATNSNPSNPSVPSAFAELNRSGRTPGRRPTRSSDPTGPATLTTANDSLPTMNPSLGKEEQTSQKENSAQSGHRESTATDQVPENAIPTTTQSLSQIAEASAVGQRSINSVVESESPLDPDSFRARKNEIVQVSGTVLQVRTSKSGKTNYLHFTQDWNQSLMIYALASDIPLEQLQPFQGKKIQVRGAIVEEFGSNRVGIKLKAVDQIEILP